MEDVQAHIMSGLWKVLESAVWWSVIKGAKLKKLPISFLAFFLWFCFICRLFSQFPSSSHPSSLYIFCSFHLLFTCTSMNESWNCIMWCYCPKKYKDKLSKQVPGSGESIWLSPLLLVYLLVWLSLGTPSHGHARKRKKNVLNYLLWNASILHPLVFDPIAEISFW